MMRKKSSLSKAEILPREEDKTEKPLDKTKIRLRIEYFMAVICVVVIALALFGGNLVTEKMLYLFMAIMGPLFLLVTLIRRS